MVRYQRKRFNGSRGYSKYRSRSRRAYTGKRLSRGRPMGRNRRMRQKWMSKGGSKIDRLMAGQQLYETGQLQETIQVGNTGQQDRLLDQIVVSQDELVREFRIATNTRVDPTTITRGKIHALQIRGGAYLKNTFRQMISDKGVFPRVKGIKISVLAENTQVPTLISFRKTANQNYVFKEKVGRCSVFLKRYKTHQDEGDILNSVICGAYGPCNVRIRFYIKFAKQGGINNYVPGGPQADNLERIRRQFFEAQEAESGPRDVEMVQSQGTNDPENRMTMSQALDIDLTRSRGSSARFDAPARFDLPVGRTQI